VALASNPKTHIAIVRAMLLCRALLVRPALTWLRFAGLDQRNNILDGPQLVRDPCENDVHGLKRPRGPKKAGRLAVR
jgi:hypothetical protein